MCGMMCGMMSGTYNLNGLQTHNNYVLAPCMYLAYMKQLLCKVVISSVEHGLSRIIDERSHSAKRSRSDAAV